MGGGQDHSADRGTAEPRLPGTRTGELGKNEAVDERAARRPVYVLEPGRSPPDGDFATATLFPTAVIDGGSRGTFQPPQGLALARRTQLGWDALVIAAGVVV